MLTSLTHERFAPGRLSGCEQIAAIYHSHTSSPAEPSQTDINLAEYWPDPLYLICSLAEPEAPSVRGFSIREGHVEEVELDLEGDER